MLVNYYLHRCININIYDTLLDAYYVRISTKSLHNFLIFKHKIQCTALNGVKENIVYNY